MNAHRTNAHRALILPTLLCVPSARSLAADPPAGVPVAEESFKCMTKMAKVRGFYVDNLLGKLDQTLAVARSSSGGAYPPGSVIQLVPTEVMVKQPPGTNSATCDWEFFELDVSAEGSKIRRRGYVDVVNRFGGNCFGCHVAASLSGISSARNHTAVRRFRSLRRCSPRCRQAIRAACRQIR